ncbi:hypothetical protein VTH06DRAFT_5854 [Thermothelomyces fergusii]
MSSYPPPPAAPTSDGTGPTDSAQQGADADNEQTDAPAGHSLFATEAAAAAVAAAHHGLQALQAAVAAPPPPAPGPGPGPVPVPVQVQVPVTASPVSSQHASLADAAYLAGTNVGQPQLAVPPGQKANANPAKATRLRRACDMCSQRKVKCDETHPCRPCTDLGVDCTFNRVMKRRGPPNKHAEAAKAAKQQRLEPGIGPGPHHAAETLISISGAHDGQHVLDAESIAPWPVLTLLIDDFFTYIHPLAPFPHEPTFRLAFSAREDRTNRGFLSLLASMIGCLVASFPRTARLHLKTQQQSMNMYPKAINLIERCRAVALAARGASFYSRDDVTVYDAATSYFLGVAAAYTMQWKVCRRFMAESMTFIRELGYHKPRDMGSSMFGVTYRGPPFNHVEDQLGKRIFWCLFLGLRSMYQLGTHHSDTVLPPPTPGEPYPDLPVEVDDQYILTHQILGQPEHTLSLLAGFNYGVKIYMTMNGLVSVEQSYGISTLPFHDQKAMLDESLQAVKQILDGLPRELTIDLDAAGPSSKPSHNLPNTVPTVAQAGVLDNGTSPLHYFPISYVHLQAQQQQQQQQQQQLQPQQSQQQPQQEQPQQQQQQQSQQQQQKQQQQQQQQPPPQQQQQQPQQQQPTADYRHKPGAQPERRRLLQYEIQKANIYASQIATRSYYVERYLNLRDAQREHAGSQTAQASTFAATQLPQLPPQPADGTDTGGPNPAGGGPWRCRGQRRGGGGGGQDGRGSGGGAGGRGGRGHGGGAGAGGASPADGAGGDPAAQHGAQRGLARQQDPPGRQHPGQRRAGPQGRRGARRRPRERVPRPVRRRPHAPRARLAPRPWPPPPPPPPPAPPRTARPSSAAASRLPRTRSRSSAPGRI